jgi:hypothetical protein
MPGKVWEVGGAGDAPVWLVECEWTLRVRRRLLLVLDASDSVATSGDDLRTAASSLMDLLDVGDTVVIWVLGQQDSVRTIEIIQRDSRHEAVQALLALKSPVHGSWLRPTWEGVRRYASRALPGVRDFILTLSDGEIFDADSDLPPLDSPMRWVRVPGPREPIKDFRDAVREVRPTPADLGAYLACPRAEAWLLAECPGATRAVTFDDRGALGVDYPNPGKVRSDIPRLALVGGELGAVGVAYFAGASQWSDIDFERHRVDWPSETHLQEVLRALRGGGIRWYRDKITGLLNASTGLVCEKCPDRPRSAMGKMFCKWCGHLLLSPDRLKPHQVPARVMFRLLPEGALGEDKDASDKDSMSPPWSIIHEDGEEWLLLNLGAG